MTKWAVQISWNETPHLSDSAKSGLVSSYMPHERLARTQGVPSLGSGVIYPVPEEDILCDPMEFPAHYRFVYALDVGWSRTAALWGAIDPESDVLYLWSEHYRGHDIERALAAGCAAVITKPFDITTFLNTIDRLLQATHERSVGS